MSLLSLYICLNTNGVPDFFNILKEFMNSSPMVDINDSDWPWLVLGWLGTVALMEGAETPLLVVGFKK